MLGGQRAVEPRLRAGPAQSARPCDERPGDPLAGGHSLLEAGAEFVGARPVGGAPDVAVGRPGHRHDDLAVRAGPQVGEAGASDEQRIGRLADAPGSEWVAAYPRSPDRYSSDRPTLWDFFNKLTS